MNLEKAKKIIKERCHKMFLSKNENMGPNEARWNIKYESGWSYDYTDRELIKEARKLSKERTDPIDRLVKENSKKNRKIEKQIIHEEKFDEIPQGKPVYRDDRWNWD